MPGPANYERETEKICAEIRKLALEILERKRAIRKCQERLLTLDEE